MECAKKDSDIIIREERDGTCGEWRAGEREKKSDTHREMNLEVMKQLELKTYNLVEKRRLFCYWC